VNVVDPILIQSRFNPGAPAICAPGTQLGIVSYGKLEQFIHNVGRKAASLGLAQGQTVAIFVADKILHAALILGLTRAGIVTLSGRDSALPSGIKADAVIADQRYPHLSGLTVIPARTDWLTGDGRAVDDGQPSRGSGDDLCRIILTSGTTGEPKAVAMTHRLLQDRIARYQYVKGNRFPSSTRVYCDLGLASSPGFRYMLHMLWRGGTIFFFGADADSTLDAFDQYNIQTMIASPHGLAEYLKFYEMADAYQCGFDHIISTGSLVSKSLSERIRSRMCHNLFCSYGSTEVSTVASAPAHVIADIPGAVGFVMPGVTVEIVDAADRPLPAGQDGIVRIRSAFNVDGYIGSPQDSAKAFRNGWFYPGDVGRMMPGQLLVISGREKTTLNLGGDKVAPEVIERIVAAFAGIEQVAVVGVEDELGIEEVRALVVARAPWDEQALRQHCARHLPEGLVPARFLAVERLPVTEGNKLDRRRLKDLAGQPTK
jgi:acyl-CoA synthetase (AMP-forming)/AMP-acid ligase II